VNERSLEGFSRAAAPWRLGVAHALDAVVVGTIGPVCLTIWRTKPSLELFELQRLELEASVAKNPGQVGFLCVVETTSDPPDQAVRDASAAMISSLGKRLAACACVIEGTGFRAAITRTVLSGMQLVARNSAPTRFFERVPIASAWMTERLGRGRDTELSALVEEARAARR